MTRGLRESFKDFSKQKTSSRRLEACRQKNPNSMTSPELQPTTAVCLCTKHARTPESDHPLQSDGRYRGGGKISLRPFHEIHRRPLPSMMNGAQSGGGPLCFQH